MVWPTNCEDDDFNRDKRVGFLPIFLSPDYVRSHKTTIVLLISQQGLCGAKEIVIVKNRNEVQTVLIGSTISMQKGVGVEHRTQLRFQTAIQYFRGLELLCRLSAADFSLPLSASRKGNSRSNIRAAFIGIS